jgi:osmotically inducible protein OsmC
VVQLAGVYLQVKITTMKRTGNAHWEGTGKDGKGTLSTQNAVLNKTQYSWSSRFEEGVGTNPEELIAAAHSGCFTMKLSFVITGAGFVPTSIDTKATVTLENGEISSVFLETEAIVPGLTDEKFQEMALEAKLNCPVSKLFKAEISLAAVLK